MNDYFLILSTLGSTLMGYYFCCHSIAVARNGGPAGDGVESLQRVTHPIRFWIYVAITGVIGLLLALVAVQGYVKLWSLITHG